MKHENVVALLTTIADKGVATTISFDDLQELKAYNLINVTKDEETKKNPACTLTKKGRVMLKHSLKP